MKNLKLRKILLTICSAMLLVTLSVGATFAYLTSKTGPVVNTFTVGNVAITLDEADVDDSTLNAERDTANAYKLMPGHKYTKDPIIHVADTSEDCWLFVKVVDEIADIEDVKTVATQMNEKGWSLVAGQTDVYAYSTKVSAGADVVVFESFKIKGGVTNEALADYDGKTITVQAYAVQADGIDTAAAAWTAAPCTWGE